MASVTCPRCGTVAEEPEGTDPLCPGCGFPGPDLRATPPPAAPAWTRNGIAVEKPPRGADCVMGLVVAGFALLLLFAVFTFVKGWDGDERAHAPWDDTDEPSFDIGFSKDTAEGTLTVTRVDDGVMWTDLGIEARDARWSLDSPAVGSAGGPSLPERAVQVGDRLYFCTEDAAGAMVDVYEARGGPLQGFYFESLPSC